MRPATARPAEPTQDDLGLDPHYGDAHVDRAMVDRLDRRRARRGATAGVAVACAALGVAAWGSFGSGLHVFDRAAAGEHSGSRAAVAPVTNLTIDATSADVDVRYAGSLPQAVVEWHTRGDVRVTQSAGSMRIEQEARPGLARDARSRITVTLPLAQQATHPAVSAHTTSGDVAVSGAFGDASASSTSGDLRLDGSWTRLRATSTSGDVRVNGATPSLEAESTSGNVTIDGHEVASLRAVSTSGNVGLVLRGAAPTNVEAKTTSGNLDLDVPDGSYRVSTTSRSGRVTNQLPSDPSGRGSVSASSASGDVSVR